ncbi:MAG TPA: phosphatidylcholine/phosphatidylserine synthase [Gemmatimonadota bacterium]
MRPRLRPRGQPRLRRSIHVLPNLFTIGNLFFGYFSITASVRGDFDTAAVAIILGAVLDALDGAVARLVRSPTPFGVQLDSLADVVTFGIAPAVLAYLWGIGGLEGVSVPFVQDLKNLGWIGSFAFLVGGALRLARYNVASQEPAPVSAPPRHFTGMPIPTAAGTVAATVHFFKEPIASWTFGALWTALVFALGLFMVSTVPFVSLRHFLARHRRGHLVVGVVGILLAAIYVYSEVVLFGLLVLYLTYSAWYNLVPAVRRWEDRPTEQEGALGPHALTDPASDAGPARAG